MRDVATQALASAYAPFADWLEEQIASGDAVFAHAVIRLQRRTLGALLRYTLDHQMWEQVQAIIQALNSYWTAQGLDEEAYAWIERAELALRGSEDSPPRLDTPYGDLWLYITGVRADQQQRAMRLDEIVDENRHIRHRTAI